MHRAIKGTVFCRSHVSDLKSKVLGLVLGHTIQFSVIQEMLPAGLIRQEGGGYAKVADVA